MGMTEEAITYTAERGPYPGLRLIIRASNARIRAGAGNRGAGHNGRRHHPRSRRSHQTWLVKVRRTRMIAALTAVNDIFRPNRSGI